MRKYQLSNLSVKELKHKSAEEHKNTIHESKEILLKANDNANKILDSAHEEIKYANAMLNSIYSEYKAKKLFIDSNIPHASFSVGMKVKKDILGKIKAYEISPNKLNELSIMYTSKIAIQEMQEKVENDIAEYKQSVSYETIHNLKNSYELQIKDLKNNINDLLQKNRKLINSVNNLNANIKRINKVFSYKPGFHKTFLSLEREILNQEHKRFNYLKSIFKISDELNNIKNSLNKNRFINFELLEKLELEKLKEDLNC